MIIIIIVITIIIMITPNLPTKIIPVKICRLGIITRIPMDMRIPPLKIKILLESNPLKSRILVQYGDWSYRCNIFAAATADF